MNVDRPYISQRSIVAYSKVAGTPAPGEWYAATLRRAFAVESQTAATLTITAGASISSHIRAVVDGAGIRIECLFDSTGYPSEPYGVSGTGVLTVEVTTAGDANFAGTTATFSVNVLVLGYDLPYCEPMIAEFRRSDRSVNYSLSPHKEAGGSWIDFSVQAVGGAASGGQAICAYIDGELRDSGLILHNDNGRMWISGVPARPGVYRIYFDLESNVQGTGAGSLYHPFPGGKGNHALVIWIYEDYLPGDLVSVLPNADKSAHIAIPFAPAKIGDVGLAVEVPGGGTVLHSLSNRFADAGSLALTLDAIAGPMWKRYPLRRLLSLFSVGAKVKMHFKTIERTVEYDEDHGTDEPEHDNTGDYPDGIPSVGEIDAAGGAIIVGQREEWNKTSVNETARAETDVEFDLSYALWSADFPKYLDALLSRSTHTTNRQTSFSRDRRFRSKRGGRSTTYRVETITRQEAIDRGIPFPGDGQGEVAEEVVAGEVKVTVTHYDAPDESFSTTTATATFSGGSWITSGDFWIQPTVTTSVGGGSTVTLNVSVLQYPATRTFTATGSPRAAISEHWTDPPEEEWQQGGMDYDIYDVQGFASLAGDSPGADGPHAGEPTPDGEHVRVVYAAEETLGIVETQTAGNATESTGSDFAGHGTATLAFAAGRGEDWPHRAVCAAVGGEGGVTVNFATANAQRMLTVTTTNGGRRSRSGGGAAWSYDYPATAQTWGTTTTTTEIDTGESAAVGGTAAYGDTFQTGIVALILGAYAMGTLAESRRVTTGSASGSAYGYMYAGGSSADVTPVSGTWSEEAVTVTNAPGKNESTGTPLEVEDVDLSGEVEDGGWEQWGYSYQLHTLDRAASIRVEVVDTAFPDPEQNSATP